MPKSKLATSQNLIDILMGGITTIAFNKKTDGSLRIMRCTLSQKLIPAADMPKHFDPKKFLADITGGRLRVYDLEKRGWRTIPISELHYIRDDAGKSYTI